MWTFALVSALAGAAEINLSSKDLADGRMPESTVFQGFGCTGPNQAPDLAWEAAPEGTKSFALLVHDPDAPTGGAGWWHWVVYDIPAGTRSLPRGAKPGAGLPEGAVEGPTDFGAPGWGGPCPPEGAGDHTYTFTLYALPVEKLAPPPGATASLIGFLVTTQALDSHTIRAAYGR